MIWLKNVTKSFVLKGGSRHYVFRDLSLKIERGTNVALMGRNGSGKSTLMSLISGNLAPDSGRVVCRCSVSWPVGIQTGFQGSMTGRENVQFVSRIHGDSYREMCERVEFVAGFADLGAYFDMPVQTYSAGMRSRLGFAMSMAFDFDVYLADEITSVGDHVFKKKSAAAFEEKRGKASVIMVSHDVDTIREWCDKAIYIENGQHTIYDNINDAIERYRRG